MSSVSNSESSTEEQSSPDVGTSSPEPAVSSEVRADESGDDEGGEGSSLFDKLDTAATVLRVSVLAFVVVFTLIPVVGLLVGWAPFDPPPKLPYFALVGFALVGTVALVGAELWDV
ncbi:hypothetical protein [Halorussus ruber]|uniref:hypothetical protein n=1 Tax=Halorussus ruber TaxID=1126238 RepID=UPI001092FD15|nr:hypothetical protein [Halorussus ruber]